MDNLNKKEREKEQDRQYILLGLRIIGEFGASIAIPIVILAYIGKFLDTKFATKPLFLIIGFLLAAVTSARIIYIKANYFGKIYKEIDNEKKQNPV